MKQWSCRLQVIFFAEDKFHGVIGNIKKMNYTAVTQPGVASMMLSDKRKEMDWGFETSWDHLKKAVSRVFYVSSTRWKESSVPHWMIVKSLNIR